MSSSTLTITTIITTAGFLSTFGIENNYQCFDSYCICLDQQCETNCANGFCQNKDFFCTGNVTHCSFNCQEPNSCKNSKFYMASTYFQINCTASNSCHDININCGIPQTIPYGLTSKAFDHNMQTCGISAFSSSSITNTHISCDENIEHCYMESLSSETGVIIDSEFQCNIDIGLCNLKCNNGCTQSFYACNTYPEQCYCQGCDSEVTFIETSSSTNKISTTYLIGQHVDINVDTDDSDTEQTVDINNETTILLSDGHVFNLTDGVITNLEVLYYIVLGAGGCLCCCICLCISVVCFVRKSIYNDDISKSFEKTPTISTFGLNGSDVPSVDPSIDLPPSQSNHSRSAKDKQMQKLKSYGNSNSSSSSSDITIHNESEEKAEIEENINKTPDSFKVVYQTNSSTPSLEPLPHIIEMKSNSISNHSASQQHDKKLTITLTKPITEKSHKKRRKGKRCKASKHMKSPKPSLSPNSTQFSLSNPDPNEGTTMHERMMSEASSECNLASKIDHDRVTQQRQQQQFNVIQDLHNPFASNAVRRQIAYAAQQRQILFAQHQQQQTNRNKNPFSNNSSYNNNHTRHRLQQQQQQQQPQQLQMIKPSMRHKHTATPSNPTLPVIDSEATINHTHNDPNFSTLSMDEITNTEAILNTPEPSRHRYTSSAISTTTVASTATSNSSSSSSSRTCDSDSYTYTEDTCSCSDCHENNDEDTDCDQCSCHRYRAQNKYDALTVKYNPSTIPRSSQCSSSASRSSASSDASSSSSSSDCSNCSSVTDSSSSSDCDTEITGTVTSVATSKGSKGRRRSRRYTEKKTRIRGYGQQHSVVINNMNMQQQSDGSDDSGSSSDDDDDDVNERRRKENERKYHIRGFTENTNLTESRDDERREHERFRTLVIHSPNSNQPELHYD